MAQMCDFVAQQSGDLSRRELLRHTCRKQDSCPKQTADKGRSDRVRKPKLYRSSNLKPALKDPYDFPKFRVRKSRLSFQSMKLKMEPEEPHGPPKETQGPNTQEESAPGDAFRKSLRRRITHLLRAESCCGRCSR